MNDMHELQQTMARNYRELQEEFRKMNDKHTEHFLSAQNDLYNHDNLRISYESEAQEQALTIERLTEELYQEDDDWEEEVGDTVDNADAGAGVSFTQSADPKYSFPQSHPNNFVCLLQETM